MKATGMAVPPRGSGPHPILTLQYDNADPHEKKRSVLENLHEALCKFVDFDGALANKDAASDGLCHSICEYVVESEKKDRNESTI